MLATLAAIQVLLFAQTKLSEPGDQDPNAAAPQQEAPPAEAPLPSRPRPAERGAAPAAPTAPVPTAPTAPAPAPGAEAPTVLSLLSAEPLAGGSAGLGWIGWSSFGAMYGQGLTATDDLGALFDFNWATSEMRLGAWYRRPLGTAGPFRLAGRLGASWYLDFGTHWAYEGNHGDRGIQVAPGLILSMPGAGGVFSISGDFPITVTVWHDGGLLVQPRASVSYETPLYDPISVGIRGGIGYRAGSGTAPIKEGRGEFELILLAGYRFF